MWQTDMKSDNTGMLGEEIYGMNNASHWVKELKNPADGLEIIQIVARLLRVQEMIIESIINKIHWLNHVPPEITVIAQVFSWNKSDLDSRISYLWIHNILSFYFGDYDQRLVEIRERDQLILMKIKIFLIIPNSLLDDRVFGKYA